MARTLKVAVQMDPIESINIDADSSFALMLEAQHRGHALCHYEVRHMALREGVRRQGERREERLPACGCSNRLGSSPSSANAAPTTRSASRPCSTSPPWMWC